MAESLNNDQIFIRKLTDIILVNLENENFGVNELAHESGLSVYSLSRKLHSITRKKISQFIREVRLKNAMELLQKGVFTVSEVAYKTGFGSPAYFNKCFREFFGSTPGEVKKSDPDSHSQDVLFHDPDENLIGKAIKRNYILTLPGILILVLLSVTSGFIVYKIIRNSSGNSNLISSDGRISLVVMPFRNITNDTTWNIWQESIQGSLISSLSNFKELKVRQKESINTLLQNRDIIKYSSISPSLGNIISQKLDAKVFIYGYIKQAGPKIRVEAQLINTRNSEVLKSFIIEKPSKEEYIFQVIDTLSEHLRNFLLVSKLIKENKWLQYTLNSPQTNSPEALRYSVYGDKAFAQGDWPNAISWYLKALAVDSNYFDPMIGLSSAFSKIDIDQDLNWVLRYYKKRGQWPIIPQLWASWAYAYSFEPPEEGIKYLRQLQQIDDQYPETYRLIGMTYNDMGQYDLAIPEFLKALELFKKWGKEYMKDNSLWEGLGRAYHKTGQYNKEKKIYKTSEKYIPYDYLSLIIFRQAILSFAEKDSVAANKYIQKFISIHKKYSTPEAYTVKRLADLYSESGMPDKAEEFYRKSLSLEPGNPERMKFLSEFLIDNNRKLDEASELMDKALKLTPGKYSYYDYLDTKGRCLLKQGKSREALEILDKAYNSTPFPMYYIYSHLQEAKKIAGGQDKM